MDANSVQPIPSTNAAVTLCASIPEVLREDNYERWSILMQHYFVAQGLWDVILSSQIPWDEDSGNWIKKNALALLAIKNSCGAETFDQIKNMNSAKDAWNALADLRKPPNVDESKGSGIDAGIMDNNERTEFATLLEKIYVGDWNALKSLNRITEIIFPGGFTILHIATISFRLKIVNELVKIARQEYLEMQDDNGDTALSLAASKGDMDIAKCLVQKNDKLLTIRNGEGNIPLVVACFNRRKCMSSYLYAITPFEFLLPENSDQGTLFLKYCVLNSMFDVGLDLFRRCPRLAAATKKSITILELSVHPSLFLDETEFEPHEQLLYKCLRNVKLPSLSQGTDSRHKVFGTQAAWVKVIDGILGVIIPRKLIPTYRMKDIYKLKLTHLYSESVLRYWCKEISTYGDSTQLVESGTISAIFEAIKGGPIEIVIKILKKNPDLIWCNKKLSRDILSAAIKYRRGRILGFVYWLDAGKKAFLSLGDEDGNNMLHLVAKLPDLRRYNNLHPVWIMQQETKWFWEVSWLLPKGYQAAKNLYGETPVQVFDKEHQKLKKEADEWVKKNADSYILVPVLIVTIMFAALFTVPGGNNQETGIPILLHRKLFTGFLICDAVSLLSASTSVLAFLVLLTSHIAPRFISLYWMLAIPSLIISIITMILAFIFALTIMLQMKWVAATLIFVLLLPIYILVNLSYFIIADAYKWTFRSIIF